MKNLLLVLSLLLLSCKNDDKVDEPKPLPVDLITKISGTYKIVDLSFNDEQVEVSDQGRNGTVKYFKSDRNLPNLKYQTRWKSGMSDSQITTDISLLESGDSVIIFRGVRIGYVLGDTTWLSIDEGYGTTAILRAVR